MDDQYQIEWTNESDTQTWAQQLAKQLAQQPGLANVTLELHGDLGAGKTTFVRHLLRALGVQGRIKSPTYALVEPYMAPAGPGWPMGLPISHLDLYRFNDPRELEEAGLRELLSQEGLKLVEWAEKAGPLRPKADVWITIRPQSNESRKVNLWAATPKGDALISNCRMNAQ